MTQGIASALCVTGEGHPVMRMDIDARACSSPGTLIGIAPAVCLSDWHVGARRIEGGAVYFRLVFLVISTLPLNVKRIHNGNAASIIPAALNFGLLVTTISTGYFHSMNRVHPR